MQRYRKGEKVGGGGHGKKTHKRQVAELRSENWALQDEMRNIADENKKMILHEVGRNSQEGHQSIVKTADMYAPGEEE